MQRILIQSISSKPTVKGGTFTQITDEKGGKFSGFDEPLAKLHAGDVIEAEIEVSGKFANIKSWKPIEVKITATEVKETAISDTPKTDTHIPKSERAYQPKDTASIEAQVAVKEIGECLRMIPDYVPKPLRSAYWLWIAAKLGLTIIVDEEKTDILDKFKGVEELKVASPLVQEAIKAGGELKSVEAKLPELCTDEQWKTLFLLKKEKGIANVFKMPGYPLDKQFGGQKELSYQNAEKLIRAMKDYQPRAERKG